jgi:hypothetical protein
VKTSEKRLALALGGLVLVFLVLLSINFYRQERSQLTQQRLLLESSAQEQNIWLRQSDLWLERSQWVRANQPTIGSPRSATADLFSALEEMASEAGVTIVKSRLYDPVVVEALDIVEIGVQLSLNASLEGIVKWAAQVQNPEEFRLFKRFTLNSRDDQPTMLLECTVIQWCVTGTPTTAGDAAREIVEEPAEEEKESSETGNETTDAENEA